MLNDQKLINLIALGDANAFKDLYNQYADKVYNTALSYAKNVPDAEEITQDVFVKIHNNASKFKGKSSLSTWIYRIAINTSLDAIKKKKNHFSLSTENTLEPVDFDHPGIALENQDDAKILFSVIDTLPDTQKTAFILSFVEELPRQEVADIMNTSLKSVESLLQRAKSTLRKKLDKMNIDRRNFNPKESI